MTARTQASHETRAQGLKARACACGRAMVWSGRVPGRDEPVAKKI